MTWRAIIVRLALAMASPLSAASSTAQSPPPDPRFKVDILLIVAHPDDESAVSGYLARAIFDEGKRVAVVYGTRGDGGGNAAGPEQAAALGLIREAEGRQALGTLGIDRAWFLDGKDTPSQDVLQSLETWHHGEALERTVRLVRLTRPEVILTWLPLFVIGENHGDHQAAGVIATEAFDLAGDPTAYPSQIAPARNRTSIGNLTEGLSAWQPKKIYYFSDRADGKAFRSHGPVYSSTAVSPARKVPYYQLTARLLAMHRTQGYRVADSAVKSGDYRAFLETQRDEAGSVDIQFIFGKSQVGGGATDDVLSGVGANPIPFRPPSPRPASRPSSTAIELGGPWSFYRAFVAAHELAGVGDLVPAELGLNPGSRIRLPVRITNGNEARLKLGVTLPPGWTVSSGSGELTVAPGVTVDHQLVLEAPAVAGPGQELVIALEAEGRRVAVTRLTVRALATMPF
jgi:LmbE family N-acetylglucosaminyl deacetylase